MKVSDNDIKKEENSFKKIFKEKIFQFAFNDTSLLIKLLYNKYFQTEIFEEIQNTNIKKISDFQFRNNIKNKIYENLIFPSKSLCEKKLIFPKEEDLIGEKDSMILFEKEIKSKKFLLENIQICKFNWSNNFTTFCFFLGLGFGCLFFNFHKKMKKISNRMFLVISFQILLNGLSLYYTFRYHPYESYLKDAYSNELEKYKIIFKE